jgi:ligand-binding sensor domain-containing protein
MQDGVFRGAPNAIAQTSDGYIWIGTESELLRFDGVRFMRWASPDGTKLPSPEIDSLLGARDGSLWIGTRAGLSHWVNGRIVNYSNPKAVIPAIVEDHDGTVWFIHIPSLDHPGSLCRVTGASVRCYGKADGIPIFASGNSLNIDSLGNLWIGLDTALVR